MPLNLKFLKQECAPSLLLLKNICIKWVASSTIRRNYLASILTIIGLVYKSTYKRAKDTLYGTCLCLNKSLCDLGIQQVEQTIEEEHLSHFKN